MRIIFMGSSEASAYTLRAILKSPQLRVAGMVTQPDRPAGRRQRLTPCACKIYAIERGIQPIICPEKVNAPETMEQITALKPDVIVVVAFGQFLGKRLLNLPPHGCINVHFSLLPKYRGAAPVQAAIAAGEEITGVTIMRMAEGMDDGDVLLQAIEPICSDDTTITLTDRLSILGAVTIVKTLKLMESDHLKIQAQDHTQATFAPKLERSDGLINWQLTATVIERRIRAYDPWPGAFTFLPKRFVKPGWPGRIKVIQAEIIKDLPADWKTFKPGTICGLTPNGPLVTTAEHALCLTTVQPDGSRLMTGRTFLNGRPLRIGEFFTNGSQE